MAFPNWFLARTLLMIELLNDDDIECKNAIHVPTLFTLFEKKSIFFGIFSFFFV